MNSNCQNPHQWAWACSASARARDVLPARAARVRRVPEDRARRKAVSRDSLDSPVVRKVVRRAHVPHRRHSNNIRTFKHNAS